MKRWLKNERGVTMIEVILAFALLTMVLIVISSVQLTGQRQFADQTAQIDSQTNIRLAFKWITGDVRKRGAVHEVSGSSLKVGTPGAADAISYTYSESDQAILRDGAVIAENIASFMPNYNTENDKLTLKIKSAETPHQKDLSKEFTTVIYIRK